MKRKELRWGPKENNENEKHLCSIINIIHFRTKVKRYDKKTTILF